MRTIILLLDWDSTLFWRDDEGCGRIDESTLPISDGLRRMLGDYYKKYSEIYLGGHDHSLIPELDKRLLDDAGLVIWRELLRELADIYRVLFYSEQFEHSFEDPEEFVTRRKDI